MEWFSPVKTAPSQSRLSWFSHSFSGSRSLAAAALLALVSLCLLWAQADDRRRIFQEIDRSLQDLASISGLKAKKPIHYDLITKDKVNEFLKERVKESAKADEVR